MIQNINIFLIEIIKVTPWWVWIILAYIIFIGIKATKNRVIYLPRLFILPLMLIIIRFKGIFVSDNIMYYCISFTAGNVIGFIKAQKTKIQCLNNMMIELPGNYSTLIILILFFLMKYVFGYLKAVNPDLASRYAHIDLSLSALFSGYFLGIAINYAYRYYKTSK